jgi:uncharacterized protein with von Willebrand factor type A (vWA) domain
MIPNFFNLRRELARSLENLKPHHSFNVIFFKDERAYALDEGSLRAADSANRQAAMDFAARIVPAGRTDPLPAIRLAFAQQPDLICVITDGFDNAESLAAVTNEFARLNGDRRVTVNAVLIRGSDDPQLESSLRAIAHSNGGMFRAIENARRPARRSSVASDGSR